MKWRSGLAALYLLMLCVVLYKQHRFLHQAWAISGEERRSNPLSGLHFARELQSFVPDLDCRREVVLYHRLPAQPEDYQLYMLSRFALSPCSVLLSENELLVGGQRIVHRSHPAFPREKPGLFARL